MRAALPKTMFRAPAFARSSLVGILFLGGLCACSGGDENSDERSAILITLDTTRADALSCYGVYPDVTPILDTVAEESVVYEFAHTVVPITLPAHSSMLTGLYPIRHTVRDNGYNPLPRSANTLAEVAQAAGHQTAAIVASAAVDPAFGLDQGFDSFDAPSRSGADRSNSHFAERPAPEVVDEALAWLAARDRSRPFFLWVHLFDPHGPYEPPEEFLSVTERNGVYYGEVAYMDDELGRFFHLLREQGVLDSATLLVVGDHGEALGEHDELTHCFYTYESTLKVPFLLRYPDGHRSGERSSEVVSVVDVYPTLAEAMQLPAAPGIDGMSLYRRRVPEDRGVYFETYSGFLSFGWSPLVGWLDAKGKYLHSSEPQFFDLAADPGETRNMLEEGEHDVSAYLRAIGEVAGREVLEGGGESITDKELLQHLSDLGYVVGGGASPTDLPHPLEDGGLPSPASMTEIFARVQYGMTLMNANAYQEAKTVFEAILEENDRNWFVLDVLSNCLIKLQRYPQALPHLELLVQETPARAGIFFNLGACYVATGRSEEGVELMIRGIELDDSDPFLMRDLVMTLRRMGRKEQADEYDRRLRKLLSGR
jgi:arylsulfatase A-like enzyme